MSGYDDFDGTLADWFEAEAMAPAPAGGLDRVLDVTRRRVPRPAWLAGPGSHWVGEPHGAGSSPGLRWLPLFGLRWSRAIILLLVIGALVAATILVGARLIHPSPFPTGRLGHLAYGLNDDIYVADWDGGNPVRIADSDPGAPGCGYFWGEGPMWSPDGRHLAYRSGDERCSGTVRITDPEGHVIASFPGTGWLVSWSPDSTRVATWVEMFQTVGIYGLNGVRQALLTVPPGCAAPGDFDPVWSPDARSLVIAPCEVPVDGGPAGRLPPDVPRSHLQWAYSPDRSRVAYITSESLVLAAADGSRTRVLVSAGVAMGGPGSPVWSPTGDRIAFGEGMYPAPGGLRVVDVASGTVTSLADAHGSDSLRVIDFSPDGDRILFSISNDTTAGATTAWSVRADGSDARVLVTGTGGGDFDWQVLPAGQ